MRWYITLPLLLGALSACEDATVEIDERDPIIRPDVLPVGPEVDPVIIPVYDADAVPYELQVLLEGHPAILLVDDPRIDFSDLDGDEFPDVVLEIPWEGLDPIDPDLGDQ